MELIDKTITTCWTKHAWLGFLEHLEFYRVDTKRLVFFYPPMDYREPDLFVSVSPKKIRLYSIMKEDYELFTLNEKKIKKISIRNAKTLVSFWQHYCLFSDLGFAIFTKYTKIEDEDKIVYDFYLVDCRHDYAEEIKEFCRLWRQKKKMDKKRKKTNEDDLEGGMKDD